MIPALLLLVTLFCDPASLMLERGLEVRIAGDLPEATNALSSARACHPEDRNIQLELAMTLAWQQRFDEALALFSLRLETDSEDREARLGLARVLSWARNEDEALAHYRILLAIDPDDIQALNGFAFASRVDWQIGPARTAYDRILALEPENPEALEGLRQLKQMKRFTADLQLGGFMVSDGQRVLGNRASLSYRVGPRTSLTAAASTSSRLGGPGSGTEKAASLSLARQLGSGTAVQLGYRVREASGGPEHQISASISKRLGEHWSTSVAVRTNAANPGAEVLTRADLQRQLGSTGFAQIQYYRLSRDGGPNSQSLVLGARLKIRRLFVTPNLTSWQQGDGTLSVNYAIGLALPVKSALVGLQIGGSVDSPRPRIGYVVTLR